MRARILHHAAGCLNVLLVLLLLFAAGFLEGGIR